MVRGVLGVFLCGVWRGASECGVCLSEVCVVCLWCVVWCVCVCGVCLWCVVCGVWCGVCVLVWCVSGIGVSE